MTSLSHKNHPITAPLTGSEFAQRRSLWKQFLTGALCLCFAGSLPANDRDGAKPLERLKQRSARQRWREMRGDVGAKPEVAPATTPATEPPQLEATPISSQMRTQARPIPSGNARPAVNDSTATEAQPAVPVPAPVSVDLEAGGSVVSRPGSKPPADINEPTQHAGSFAPGSFGDVAIEPRVSTQRQRTEIVLPHWPFQDDLDLISPDPFADSSVATDESQVTVDSASNGEEAADSSPRIQVAEVPSDLAGPSSLVADAVPPAPPAEDVPFPRLDGDTSPDAGKPVPYADPIHRLKSIAAIQPFFDYTPNGGDAYETLCPRPAGGDPNKAYKQCPEESALLDHGSLERNNSAIPVYWQASNVYHNPLYFEDIGLERSGHAYSDLVQPFVSVGKFGVQFVALPYSIALDPAWKHETPLGHYRPGECAPKRHLAVPLNGEAAAVAAAAYTGIIFLVP